MNCIIIEDELANQRLIKLKLNQFFNNINILKIIDNKIDAINFLNENLVDFIFLDIQIKGGTGFDVLNNCTKNNFDIIFITAFEEYAIDAFKKNATHYLLKPFNDQDFCDAVNRIITKKSSLQLNKTDFIFVPNKNEINKINVNEILFFKSDGSYTEIQLIDKKYTSSKSIGEIEKILDEKLFFRVHHSYIVNISKIDKIEKGRSGSLLLNNSHLIPISQRKMNNFLNKFE